MNNDSNILLDMKDILLKLKETVDSLAQNETAKLENLLKDKDLMESAVKSYLANKNERNKQ